MSNSKKNTEEYEEGLCPKCGWDPIEADSHPDLISNYHGMAMMYWNWDETHTCQECDTEFTFSTGT